MITWGNTLHPSFGLAADGKPANVPNGHMHVEIDTGKIFLYDEAGDTWNEEQGGGGGGSSLPSVTSSDNGDVLGVVDGAWGKMEAPSGLPEVSSTDNGDVLTVVDGEWAKAAPSGGGTVVIQLSQVWDSTSQKYVYTNGNYTYEDIKNLVNSGKQVVLFYYNTRYELTYFWTSSNGNNVSVEFSSAYNDGTLIYIYTFKQDGGNGKSQTLRFIRNEYSEYAQKKEIKLTESGTSLVAGSEYIITSISGSEKYYITGVTDSPYDTSKIWFSTVEYHYHFYGGNRDITIKNELTGELYKNDGTSLTFNPYTPTP